MLKSTLLKTQLALKIIFYVFSTLIVEGIFFNLYFYIIHVIFNASNKKIHKKINFVKLTQICITIASITNTPYLTLFF